MSGLTSFIVLTVVLTIALSASITTALRVNIAENWAEKRCDPYIVPIASLFKPDNDERTPSQFAADNLDFCQRIFIEKTVKAAAAVPEHLAEVTADNVQIMSGLGDTVGSVFVNLWRVFYDTLAMFMGKMKNAAKLFQLFFVNMYSVIDRIQGSMISVIFGLISVIVAAVNSIQLVIIVNIIIIGIITALMILLFLILLPIAPVIVGATVAVSIAVVTVTTAIAASLVSEMFVPGACFVTGTRIVLWGGETRAIEVVAIGDRLVDGAYVTATHLFRSSEPTYMLDGVGVTGDHLVYVNGSRIFVRDHPRAVLQPAMPCDLRCLTTTTRRIYAGSGIFADWEEIPDDDVAAQKAWYEEVWRTLNPTPPPAPAEGALEDAGLAPDCMITCTDWMGCQFSQPISALRIGDRVCDGPDSTTRVIGLVSRRGDMTTDAISIGPAIVSRGTWIWSSVPGIWTPATGTPTDRHPNRWLHLYTESGIFMIGDLRVRDASDVGLDRLKPLVEAVVLG
jgi:hypothetical protein